MFDEEAPFLQEPSLRSSGKKDWRSPGYLFAELAVGTNVAHFHHGDNKNMRLCGRCATMGMLRLVSWTQAGGSGLTPSVHGAPPIVTIASGENLAVTLGLNLIPLPVDAGTVKWAGHFAPTDKDAEIPYLEAFTWNPRRVHLPSPDIADRCWRCGQSGIATVGQIVFLKNKETSKSSDKQPFQWQDPAAFYAEESPYTTMKSSDKSDGIRAAHGRDLKWLLATKDAPTSPVVLANPGCHSWHLVIPCTNPANNKTFDHRQLELTSLSPDGVRSSLPRGVAATGPQGLDGWGDARRGKPGDGSVCFVATAARLLTHSDWSVLSVAAYRDMHDSPAAFDILSGLHWSLRGKVAGLPSRNVAWLLLKLMASVPPRARVWRRGAVFCPLSGLPKRQLNERRANRSSPSRYPVSFPRGRRLEAGLRRELDMNMRQRIPAHIDWPNLSDALNQLLD